MSLIIASGSNLGNKFDNLFRAKAELSKFFKLIFESRIYESEPVDYTLQPQFYNQVLEFEKPALTANDILDILLEIEIKMGRKRDIPKGPRIIDLDILFIALESHNDNAVNIPHPRLFERSFVVVPLRELPYFSTLSKQFNFPTSFNNTCSPVI